MFDFIIWYYFSIFSSYFVLWDLLSNMFNLSCILLSKKNICRFFIWNIFGYFSGNKEFEILSMYFRFLRIDMLACFHFIYIKISINPIAATCESCSPNLFTKAVKLFAKAADQSCSPKLLSKDVPHSCSPKLLSKIVPQSCAPKRLTKAAVQSCFPYLISKAVHKAILRDT